MKNVRVKGPAKFVSCRERSGPTRDPLRHVGRFGRFRAPLDGRRRRLRNTHYVTYKIPFYRSKGPLTKVTDKYPLRGLIPR